MRGRRPKPAALKILTGNPGKRAVKADVAAPTGRPKPPGSLSKAARKAWKEVTRHLEEMRILTRVDRGLIAAYAQAVADFDDANAHLQAEGYLLKSPNGYPIQNPWLSIRKAAVKDIVRIAEQFGLSPSARARIHADAPENQKGEDASEKFLFGRAQGERHA